jgi:hypothetical protein
MRLLLYGSGVTLNLTGISWAVGEDNVIRSRVFPGWWLAVGDLLAGNMVRVLSVLQEDLASSEYATFVEQLAEH